MPTYAILGATGSTGSSLVSYLHERPDKVRINLYARSASKLESLHPYIKGTENVKSFVGDLSRADLLKDCLRDVDVIFSTVAQDINEPGCSTLSDDEAAPPLLSYDDLARGMVQMAEEDGGHKWVGKGVGVGATGDVKNDIGPLIKYKITGLIAYFFPAGWRFCNGRLWSFD
ncbi:hypothetical protein MMC08_004815 [Hypocenomyce scalaris]|nr:hypothetical protein [Hypocenomyce scalaris]